MNCDKCIHKFVCGHQKEYAEIKEQLPKPTVLFKVRVSCEQYKEEKPLPRDMQGLQQYYQRDDE